MVRPFGRLILLLVALFAIKSTLSAQTIYAPGCAGINPPPAITSTGSLTSGEDAGLHLMGATPNSTCVLVVGTTNTHPDGTPLELSLSNVAGVSPGCTLNVQPLITLQLQTDSQGEVHIYFKVPDSLGDKLCFQFGVIESLSPPSVAISDALQLDIQTGDGPFNYGEALQKSLTFYYAQRAGHLPQKYPLNWRGDAFNFELEQENGQYDVDAGILNRYMDAGDTVTFTLPITSAMTLMAWSGIEFEEGFRDSNQMDQLLDTLRWHADWCVAAHPEPNVFVGQIGQGAESHSFWGAPEIHTQAVGYRPKIWWLTPSNPGSEPVGEAAAFLAAASILFQQEDAVYAATLLQHARELYSFASTYQGTYNNAIPNISSYYNSYSGYTDELAWSATWLYRATGESEYLDAARVHFAASSPNPNWSQSWGGKINGTACLLAALTGEEQYRYAVEQHLDHWQPGGGISYTSGGLAWLDTWGSLRYSANTSFIAFAYAEMVGDPDGRYRSFGESQINYMLGDNPRDSSYVCGFGVNPPIRPHHVTAHGSWNNQINDPDPNRHTLWGALVGGPASADDFDYADVRSDYVTNEVSCDYNAGLVASLGWLAQEYGGSPLPDSEFPPIEPSYGKEMFVEASILEDGATFTKLRCMLNNRSAWPARMSDALSYRIYVDLSEVFAAGYGIEDVFVESGFLDGGTLGSLQLANAASNIWFVEISYSGELIGPGTGTNYRRECQVTIGLEGSASDAAWNPGNDPSIAGLAFGQAALEKTEMISVYDAGVFVFGEEGTVDCNNNGIDDAEDIANGASDLDGNGRPDECDPDCNGDGIPDAFEIAEGAEDCDFDGIPDACQPFSDCDSDGIADACAIAGGTVPDCNGNGIPDACDIASGIEDADRNGVPDSCELSGVQCAFEITDDWGSGFTADLTFTNGGQDLIPADWVIEFDATFGIVNLWQGELYSQTNGHFVVLAPEWSEAVEPGESFSIGFQGTGSSGTIAETTDVTLNGSPVPID
ncbi:MAG: glycoside hydrolase family 9 protein [Planctomycetota bacterium]|nr:glycoside hydrolase family 9 protein [Planctomycetota bacterium]